MPSEVARVKGEGQPVRALVGDARRLPFRDRAFDLVYSNAVIEHLGGTANQQSMAHEIQRVGRIWFVTTPNGWFSFELHTPTAARVVASERGAALNDGQRPV